MHTEIYCQNLRAIDPVAAVRAIHAALIQLEAVQKNDGRALDHRPAVNGLRACLAQAGHIGFSADTPETTPQPITGGHTPGPWVEIGSSIGSQELGLVAMLPTSNGQPRNPDNAALIAAAPELLAAVQLIRAAFIHKPGDTTGNKARTAPLKHCNAEFSAALNACRLAEEKATGNA